MHLEYCILVSVNTQFSDAKIGEKKRDLLRVSFFDL